jgi:hypothetical protein
MKIFFTIIVVLHGFIHLLGFSKGYGWYDPKALTLPINKFWGSLWLISALLFLSYAFAFLQFESRITLKIGVVALILSQIIIIKFWPDAKYGTIANIIVFTVLLFGFARDYFSNMVDKEKQELISKTQKSDQSILNRKDINHLPIPVKKWLEYSGSLNRPIPAYATFKQSMRMKTKPEQSKWYSATAEQLTTVKPPAFNWNVKVDILPFVEMTGRDKFVEGKGEMLIKLNSFFTVVDAAGEKIDEGALQRYLGEIVWVPAFALSPFIEWEAINDHSAKGTLSYKGTTGSGIFYFNNDGNFSKFVAMRFKGNEPNTKRYEWIMRAKDYNTFDGIRIPTELEATWILDNKEEWTWLEMKLEEVKYKQISSGENLTLEKQEMEM